MMFLPAVTVASMLLAAIMSAIAWRIAGDERRRSGARVAALAAEIRADDVGRVLWDPPISRVHEDAPIRRVQEDAAYGTRPLVILGSGALVFGVAIAIAVVSSGRFAGMTGAFRADVPPAATASANTPAPATADPLELIALGHERVGDQLTVRGVVRNPPAGAGMERLTAVVLLFTADGGFLASGRADVDAASLRPGGDSTFAITVPHAAEVARYRVSFRTDDHVVPHLDRRHES
jgi:hypothetical protein